LASAHCFKIFSNNLKFYRFQKGYSQEKFGELVDLSSRYVSDLECGRYSPPFTTVERIAKVLDIPAYQLFKENPYAKELSTRIDIEKRSKK
jgi:transcriptional regulator with XRE-family HTH domain